MRTSAFSLILFFALSSSLLAQRGGDSGGRGGPPGGGFGGPPGGFSGRGGPPGGDSGGRGGFDPSAMIRRFDTNGNNLIDPSEAQGPAQFFLQRMAQNNPKIDLSKPVPIDMLTDEIEKMRGGGGRGSDSSGGGTPASTEPELLVPDFSLETELTPPEGFGATSSVFNVKVEERDLKEAEERMRRYDRNRDGRLTKDELQSGRWSDDPMVYDRNRDGKLTTSELAVRYANRRASEEQRRAGDTNSGGDRGGWSRSGGDSQWGRGGDRGQEERKEEVKRFGDAKSYRMTPAGESKPAGLPDFFARSDANADGQVMMNEFSSSWDVETLNEFLKWDLNNDGVIIPSECLIAVENGARAGLSTASSSSRGSSASPSAGNLSATEMDWAKRQIGRYDTNGDGQLTPKEWENMILKPIGADTSGDGVITAEEYAAFRAKKK